MSTSTLHHYVPRFLLRKFGLGKKDRVHVFDKQKNCSFVSSAKTVAAERGLYDFTFMGEEMTLEPSLAQLESVAANVLSDIESRKWLPQSMSEARAQLARFLAVQLVRTRAQINSQADFRQRMEVYLRSAGMDESFFKEDPAVGSGGTADKALFAKQIVNAPQDFSPALLEKDWLLLQTTRQHPFMIGDHPLVMHNMTDMRPRGNRGLLVEGIEIYLPISPQLTLALICPSHTTALKKGTDAFMRVSHRLDAQVRFLDAASDARQMLDAIEGGAPFGCAPESVKFYNSLQVVEAERFMFSMSDDFSLVKDMLRTHPELRTGQRMEEVTGKF